MTAPIPQPQPMSEHTRLPWYVGAQNDKLYIINRARRPSRDDIVDIPDVMVVASMNNCRDEANAALIVTAVNSYTSLKAKVEGLEDLASNIAGMDDALLKSANLGLLRATLREFRELARALLQPKGAA